MPSSIFTAARHQLAVPVSPFTGHVADLIAELSDADSAARLRQESEHAVGGTATAVGVGEKKRGKSSLINVLQGRRGCCRWMQM